MRTLAIASLLLVALSAASDSSGQTDHEPGGVFFGGPFGVLAQDPQRLFWDDSLKRLGIGTPTPAADLHIQTVGFQAAFAKFESLGAGAALQLDKAAIGNDANVQFQVGGVTKFKAGMMGSSPHSLGANWGVWDHVNAAWALTIDPSRRVGIGTGTSALTERLEVEGTIKATGIQVTTAPGEGLVLTSDPAGNGSWRTGSGSTQWTGGSGGAAIPPGVTVYAPASGSVVPVERDSIAGPRSLIGRAGTVDSLHVRCDVDPDANVVFTVFKNGAPTALVAIISAGVTVGYNASDAFQVDGWDEVGIEIVTDSAAVPVVCSWALTISG